MQNYNRLLWVFICFITGVITLIVGFALIDYVTNDAVSQFFEEMIRGKEDAEV
jgi:hypothetical protein